MANFTMDVEQAAWERFHIRVDTSRGNSWNFPCPFCSGKRSFIIWAHGTYLCRDCGEKGWLKSRDNGWLPKPEWVEQKAKQEALEQARQEARLKAKLRTLQSGKYHLWHDAMTEEQRASWEACVPVWAIDTYCLGYVENKRIVTQSYAELYVDAMTIPLFDLDGNIKNIQYRLDVSPLLGIGKYRQEFGIPPAQFYAGNQKKGKVIIVEGAKKAIVVFDAFNGDVQVIGVPSNNPGKRVLGELVIYDEIYLAYDPNSDNGVENAKRMFAGKRGGVISLPGKPDDLIMESGWTRTDIEAFIGMARPFPKEANGNHR